MIHSLNYIIYTIGSIGLVGVFFYFTKNNKYEIKKTNNKLIQTDISNDIIEVIDNTIYLPNKITKSIGIQCEFDISNLEQSGDIEIILTNSNSNYRWFRWKN
mgnify:CR=1 FL=1